MSAFIILFALVVSTVAQAHTTGQKHVHLSCPGDEHCAVVPTGSDQPPTSQTDKPRTSDKEH